MHCKVFSYEKCVCCLFLVILFVLYCSGFRIDNFPMTDNSNKKNSFVHTSTLLMPFNDILSSANSNFDATSNTQQRNQYSLLGSGASPRSFVQPSIPRHKIRHHHGQPSQYARKIAATGWPRSFHYYRTALTTTDVPANDFVTTKNSSTIQKRSSNHKVSARRSTRNRRPWKNKPLEDSIWKAYKAKHVFCACFVARNRSGDKSLLIFDIVKSYKGDRKEGNITVDASLKRTHRHFNKVKVTGQYYLLFLDSTTSNAYEADTFKSVARPRHIKVKMFKDENIRKVCSKNFVPKPAIVTKLKLTYNSATTTIELKCVVRGFPIPKIRWEKQNKTLTSKGDFYYTQYRRKESKLVIKYSKEHTEGLYKCIAIGVNNTDVKSKKVLVRPPIVELKETLGNITCNVTGIFIKDIFWTKNGSGVKEGHHFTRAKINSILTITTESRSSTEYSCSARNVFNQTGHNKITLHNQEDVPCDEKRKVYCGNHECKYVPSMNEMYCICKDGYSGQQCATKIPSNNSMYQQQSASPCNKGLMTKLQCP